MNDEQKKHIFTIMEISESMAKHSAFVNNKLMEIKFQRINALATEVINNNS